MTRDQRRHFVQRLLYEGVSAEQLAEEEGVTRQAIYQRLQAPAYRRLLEEEHEKVRSAVVEGQIFVSLNLLDYLREADTIARDSNHPKQLDAVWKLVHWVAPERQETAQTTEHTIPQAVADSLTEALNAMGERLRDGLPRDIRSSSHILEGEAAVPKPIAAEAESLV